jgi:hypothetical protein
MPSAPMQNIDLILAGFAAIACRLVSRRLKRAVLR